MEEKRHSWAKVYLQDDKAFNREWSLKGNEFACKELMHSELRLDVNGNGTKNGAKVGVRKRNGGLNQKWDLKGKCELDVLQR